MSLRQLNAFVKLPAGQIAFDPDTMKIVGKDVVEQTTQTLKNLRAILEAAGTSLQKVVKTTVFLQDMNDFGRMNEVYQEFFAGNEFPPARSAVEVARLPRDVFVEIECVALAA
ncbi:hypothetical protein HDU84_000831 [Entophlyctis sp. JEL0112]|nr:hypothetical protein HDU84_000831 [Entophlyctis sp. JEL0112]